MRSSIRENQQTTIAAGGSGGRASMILLAVVAILGLCTVLGWLASEPQPSPAEQDAKAAMEDFGCHLISHPETGHVDFVSFRRGSDIDDAMVQNLARLPQLTNLHLRDCGITDDGVAYLADSTRLAVLSLRGTKISNQGLRHVARMRDLWLLDVRNTPVTEAGLKRLANMRNLRWLWITEISDAGVDHLGQMQNLERLSVDQNQIGKEKLKQLEKALPKLVIEELQGNASDDGPQDTGECEQG